MADFGEVVGQEPLYTDDPHRTLQNFFENITAQNNSLLDFELHEASAPKMIRKTIL